MKHVGRPSNKELKMRKIKKAMRVILPITVIVIAVILIVNSKNLSKLMGNSVTEYYCEDSSYTLDGTNCVKLIKEKANVLGDIYVDGIVDIKDVTELNKLINENKFVETADINEDEMLDERDVNILQRFLVGDPIVSTTGITYDYIGKKKVCTKDYTLNGDYCEKTDVVKAQVRTIDNPVEVTITDDQNGNTDIKTGTKVTLDVKFKVNHSNKKYYYMLKTYENDKQISSSSCFEVKEQTIKQDLNLSPGKEIKGIYTIYSNASCNVVVDRFETKLYKLSSSNNPNNNEPSTNINTFTIKYNANGGSGSMSDQIITYGNKVSLSKNKFTKSNHAFNGWRIYNETKKQWSCYLNKEKTKYYYSDESNCKKYGYVIYNDEQKVAETGQPGETLTFYAQWTNQFTIKYKANGGTGSMSDQIITYGNKVSLNKNKFTKSKYGFNGWRIYNETKKQWACYLNSGKSRYYYSDESNCKKYGYVIYNDEQKVAETGQPGETLTFYAQWTNQFTIKYNANGGTGSMNNQKVTYGKTVSSSKNKFTKNNYYFNGWRIYNETKKQWSCYLNSEKSKYYYSDESNCKKYGYVIYNNEQKVAETANPGESLVFYAQWIYNYKSGIQSFVGFEKDPVGATVWPMKNLTIYKNNNGTGSTNKTVAQGAALKILDMTNKNNLYNSYVKIQYNGTTGWVDSKYVMINLPDVIPSIIYSIRNADSSIFKNNNKSLSSVTGKNLYGTSWYSYNKRLGRNEYLAPIRMSTAKKIQRAQSTALKYGNKLKIYDLYRPWDAQLKVKTALDKVLFTGKLYCIPSEFDVRYSSNGSSVSCITDSKGWFIAQNPSSHNMAKAIDVTLVTSDDNSEIKMQSNMHELSRLSVPTNSNLQKYPAEIALNKLFVGVDFKFLLSEWWHFEDDDSRITQTEAKNLSKKTLKLAS